MDEFPDPASLRMTPEQARRISDTLWNDGCTPGAAAYKAGQAGQHSPRVLFERGMPNERHVDDWMRVHNAVSRMHAANAAVAAAMPTRRRWQAPEIVQAFARTEPMELQTEPSEIRRYERPADFDPCESCSGHCEFGRLCPDPEPVRAMQPAGWSDSAIAAMVIVTSVGACLGLMAVGAWLGRWATVAGVWQ